MKQHKIINGLLVLVVCMECLAVFQTFTEVNPMYQQLFSALTLFFLLLIISLLTKQNDLKIKNDEKN